MKNLPSTLQALALMAMVLLLPACHIVLVSDYDETFDQEATAAQKDVDALFQKLINNPNPVSPDLSAEAYATDKDAYAKIDTAFDALAVRARAHQNNDGTIRSVGKIADTFHKFESLNKAGRPIHIEQARIELAIMNNEFSALIAEEILKKQGKN